MPDSNTAIETGVNATLARSFTRLQLLALILLILALWLATRPYPGVYNDARFYSFEALNALHPGRYADDLYFKYGSQDQFSVFTKLFAPIVGELGISRANILGLLFSQCLWLIGLFYFATGFFKTRRDAILGLCAVIILPFHIGFINSGETFLTPRLLAEAICLGALGAMLHSRLWLFFTLIAIATPLHPLIALGAFGVFFVYQALQKPLWWLGLAALSLVGLGLALAHIQPFSRLFVSFDPAWLAVIYVRDSFCFIANWGFYIWLPIISTTALALTGLILAEGDERRLLLACLITGWGGIFVSLIGGDLFHNVLIVDAQLWRSFWPAGIVSYFMVPAIWRASPWRPPVFFFNARFYLIFAVMFLFAAEFFPSLWLVATPMTVIASIANLFEQKAQESLPPPLAVLSFSATIVLTVGFIFGIHLAFAAPDFDGEHAVFEAATALIALGLIMISLGVFPWSNSLKPRPALLAAVSGLLVLIAIGHWDIRSPWNNYTVSADPPPALTALLPSGPIYWEGDVAVSWFFLKRPSFFSCDQGTGTLFSRQTAIAYQQRANSFRSLATDDFVIPVICPAPAGVDPDKLTEPMLDRVCQQQPALGAMVLLHDVPNAAHKLWVSPVTYDYVAPNNKSTRLIKTNRFYIYNCADLK